MRAQILINGAHNPRETVEGTIIEVDIRALSPEESKFLANLFPNTERMIQKALITEAMIDRFEEVR